MNRPAFTRLPRRLQRWGLLLACWWIDRRVRRAQARVDALRYLTAAPRPGSRSSPSGRRS